MDVPAVKKPGVFAIRDVSSLVTETHETGHELKRHARSPLIVVPRGG
jgi:basic amino acid/polyamine antiporter, APA family